LTAGKEIDRRHGGGHGALEHLHRGARDVLGRRLGRIRLARQHHARLEHHAFERDAMARQGAKYRRQHRLAHLVAAFHGVIAVDQHFGLDDRHDVLLLADRRVPREHLRVGLDAERRGIAIGDAVHLAPLREARPLLAVAGEPLGEAVQALRDQVPGRVGERGGALVDLDAGDDPVASQHFDEGRAVVGALAHRFLEQDDARQVLPGVRRREEECPVLAPGLLGRLDAERLEPLGDGGLAFVGRENAPPGPGEIGDGRRERFVEVHGILRWTGIQA
jgi:hypothetical protein